MLFLALYLLSLLGYAAFGARRLGWPVAVMPLWTLSFFMSALYLAALSGVLPLASGGLLATGLGLLAWQAVRDRQDLAGLARSLATPAIAAFLAVAVASWLKFEGAAFTGWDEFSHWGLVVKALVATHHLDGPAGAVVFKDYPPGTALLQYALLTLTGWREGVAIAAQTLTVWAVLPVMLIGVTWRQGVRLAATVVLTYGAIVSFGHDPSAMLVDHVLGVWMAGALVIAWSSRHASPGAIAARTLPVLLALPLVKASGFALALTAAVGVAGVVWIAGARLGARRWWLMALLLAAPVLSFASWKVHVAQAHFPETFRVTADATAGASADSAAARWKATVPAFGRALVSTPLGMTNAQRRPALGALGVLTLVGVGIVLVWRRARSPEDRWAVAAVHATLAVGAVLYVAGLLWLYLTAFDSYEGPRLASFDRYVGTYALTWVLVVAAQLLDSTAPGAKGRWGAVGAIAVLIGLLVRWGPYDAVARLRVPAPGVSALRASVAAKAPDATAVLPGRDRVYVVWQHTSGLEFWMLRYELAPRLVGQLAWRTAPFSLGAPYGPDDVWTRPVAARAWSDQLKAGYDYVLVGHADAAFAARYGRLFGRSAGPLEGFWRVEPGADGWVALRPAGS